MEEVNYYIWGLPVIIICTCSYPLHLPMSRISNPIMGQIFFPLFIILLYMIFSSHAVLETDSLPQGQELKDGEILVSAGKVFELKFFTPTSNKRKSLGYFSPELLHNRYLGIFYKNSDYNRPVWIANRDSPIPGKSGSLVIGNGGVLKILQDGNSSIVISSRRGLTTRAVAVLMDTGNLILSEVNTNGSNGKVLWQSFDYPTDTLLPGMRLGFRLGVSDSWNWKLSSWVSDEVPATGSFTLGADPNGTSQLIVWRNGEVYWKSGIWRSGRFENLHEYTYKFDHKPDEHERFFVLSFVHDWRITSPVFVINELGNLRKSDPEYPGNSSFHMTTLVDCHKEGVPGCVRFELPECHGNARVEMRPGYKVSSGYKYYRNQSWSIADCEALCLRKCSCVAFASLYHNGTACELWTNRSHIILDKAGYREIYVLLARPLGKSVLLPTIVGAVIFLLILSLACIYCFKGRDPNANVALKHLIYLLQRKVRAIGKRLTEEETSFVELGTTESRSARFFRRRRHLKILYYKSHGLRLFAFDVLFLATDGFSASNKLGQGGFGKVYKGKLQGGQEIAIKRLSESSNQGLKEFKNELRVLAKLQHTNLVKIVGCCVEREEKIIVYEYMPNKSLDSFLSDPDRKIHLDWKKRFHIVEGIVQGLLYLHKYSRLKTIHLDLKAANILLDEHLNAKISDFGMARIFGQDESQAITSRIAGTRGYMAPEYFTGGKYSEKSDVFSFGVLLIEIVCGKKNNAFVCANRDSQLNLVGHAWELWMEDRGLELMDEGLEYDMCDRKQAMRCIHVGLLCVQEQPTDRPFMADVAAVLNNEWIRIGPPNRPAFFFGRNRRMETDLRYHFNDHDERGSYNDATISDMVAR